MSHEPGIWYVPVNSLSEGFKDDLEKKITLQVFLSLGKVRNQFVNFPFQSFLSICIMQYEKYLCAPTTLSIFVIYKE